MSEEDIVNDILAFLDRQCIWCMKVTGGPYQRPGIPDIAVVIEGRSIWFEVKLPGEKCSKRQLHEHEFLRGSDALVAVVYCKQDVIDRLKEWDFGHYLQN